jgi:ribA/ribD-fused uncharacterized protein
MPKFTEQDFLSKYNQYVFFYGGYLSNWADTSFEDVQTGIPYNCSEQYMMHMKALLFGDHETADKIMKATFPGDQKALGRLVSGFEKEYWEKHARDIVYRGCFFKFTQHKDAHEYLMSTKNHYLVEASPHDTIWGIGLGAYDEAVNDPKNWKGLNWLGQVLTALREDLESDSSFVFLPKNHALPRS